MSKNIKWVALILFLTALFFSYTGTGLETLAQTQTKKQELRKKYIRAGSVYKSSSSRIGGGFRSGK